MHNMDKKLVLSGTQPYVSSLTIEASKFAAKQDLLLSHFQDCFTKNRIVFHLIERKIII